MLHIDMHHTSFFFFFFQAEDGIRDVAVTGVQTCALPILRTVVLPKDNEKDLADIPQEILSSLTIHIVETMDEVLQIALERPVVPLEHATVTPVAEPYVAGAEKDKSLTN